MILSATRRLKSRIRTKRPCTTLTGRFSSPIQMKISHSKFPYALISEFREPRLLNFAGDGGGSAAGGQQDGADEPAADTPAGKKWKQLREEKKAAEDAAKVDREARIKAEARAEAFDDFKKSLTPQKLQKSGSEAEHDQSEIKINPDDDKIVSTIFQREMKKLGLDQIPEVVTRLQEQTQSVQANSTLDKAKVELEAEFSGSVPFNYEEALKFAKERGYGLTFTSAKEALRVAHKEMNEKSFIEFWQGGAKPKKSVPKMAASGRAADDDVIEIPDAEEVKVENIKNLDDARKAAKQMFADDEGV